MLVSIEGHRCSDSQRKVLPAKVLVLKHSKALCDPCSQLSQIIACLRLYHNAEAVGRIVAIIEALQIIPEAVYVLALKAFEVAPCEAVERMTFVSRVLTQKLLDTIHIGYISALKFILDGFDLPIHGFLLQERPVEKPGLHVQCLL